MKPIISIICFLIIISFCYRSNEREVWKEYTCLNNFFVDTLKDEKETSNIFRMELKIKGYVKGKAKLSYFQDSLDSNKYPIILEGFVNEKIIDEWYNERCLIIYEPENPSVAGKIYVKFRVMTF